MKQQLAAMGQAMNLCLIQSPQGKMYATGMRMDFSITDPLHWSDVEEHIRMEPFVENNQTQFCPIEQVQDLQMHIGGRNKSFSEASRVMCGQWNRNTGRIGYYFGFENFVPEDGFQPPVEVIVTVVFTLKPEVMRNIPDPSEPGSYDTFHAMTNPKNFTRNDIVGHVSFEHLALCPRFEGSDEEEESDGEEENE